MSTKRSIILKGTPKQNEDGVTATTIKPGYLIKGVSVIAAQDAAATRRSPANFALEREELGAGVDNTLQGSGTISAFYASGDQVKVGSFAPGDRVLGYVASGETVNEDTLLASHGTQAGTLAAATTAVGVLARSLDNLGTVAVETFCRIEVI
jgi:hypothetical protein